MATINQETENPPTPWRVVGAKVGLVEQIVFEPSKWRIGQQQTQQWPSLDGQSPRKGWPKWKHLSRLMNTKELLRNWRHTLHLHHSSIHPNPMKSFPSTWSYPSRLLVQLSSKRRIVCNHPYATPVESRRKISLYGEVTLYGEVSLRLSIS